MPRRAHIILPALTVLGIIYAARRVWLFRKTPRLRTAILNSLVDISRDQRWDTSRACVILSGGLDSSICAEVGKDVLGLAAAFTVVATADATDRAYSQQVASAAGLQHVLIETDLQQLLEQELPYVVRSLQSFDPMTLRNEIAVTRALREAAARGFTCAVTGDGADELLGGYSFTHRLAPANWRRNQRHMAQTMQFGSNKIGQQLGVHVASPYTSRGVIRAALAFGKAECVQETPQEAVAAAAAAAAAAHKFGGPAGLGLAAAAAAPPPPLVAAQGGGGKHGEALMGKMPLRRAFPEVTTCWRSKDPIEVGCGTTLLSRPGWFDGLISDEELVQQQGFIATHHHVEIRDKEHLHYYRVFRQVFPNGSVPGKERDGSDPCPKCCYQMSASHQTFCVTCGHYDPALRKRVPAHTWWTWVSGVFTAR